MTLPAYSLGTSTTASSIGSSVLPAFLLEDDLRTTDLELVALTAHRLHEHGEVQHASAGDLHAGLVLGLGDAHRDVGLGLAQQALLELTAADDVALLARRAGSSTAEKTTDIVGSSTWMGSSLDRIELAGEHVADVGVFDAHDGDDVARVCRLGLLATKRLERVELLDSASVALPSFLMTRIRSPLCIVPLKMRPMPMRPT